VISKLAVWEVTLQLRSEAFGDQIAQGRQMVGHTQLEMRPELLRFTVDRLEENIRELVDRQQMPATTGELDRVQRDLERALVRVRTVKQLAPMDDLGQCLRCYAQVTAKGICRCR